MTETESGNDGGIDGTIWLEIPWCTVMPMHPWMTKTEPGDDDGVDCTI